MHINNNNNNNYAYKVLQNLQELVRCALAIRK